MNPVLLEKQLGLEIVDLKARAAHAVACEKINVIIGATVAGAVQDRLHASQGLGIFLGRLRLLPWQRLAPLVRVGGCWNLVVLGHRVSDRGDWERHRAGMYPWIASVGYRNAASA